MITSGLNMNNKAFQHLIFYGSIAIGKTLLMSAVTGYYRIKNKAMGNEEDAKTLSRNPEKLKLILKPNETVERVLRAHRNDLENVIPFVLLSLLYVSTNPSPDTAAWHFRAFVALRFLHSFFYIGKVRQPARFLAFCGGYLVSFSLLIQTIIATY